MVDTARVEALTAAKAAVRAYSKDPTDSNAAKVEAAWQAVRTLDAVSALAAGAAAEFGSGTGLALQRLTATSRRDGAPEPTLRGPFAFPGLTGAQLVPLLLAFREEELLTVQPVVGGSRPGLRGRSASR